MMTIFDHYNVPAYEGIVDDPHTQVGAGATYYLDHTAEPDYFAMKNRGMGDIEIAQLLNGLIGVTSLESYQVPFEETVRGVLEAHLKDLKIDAAFGRKVYQYQIGYVNTSREYLEFFGSNLLGVHVIHFTDRQVNRFFNDILDIDFISLKEDIRRTKTIDHSFKVSGDIFNLTLMYLIHRMLSNQVLSERAKHRIAYDLALIFFYRCIAAITSDWFTYPMDPKIAQVAYSRLSYKYLIKRLGSWQKVMEYRAADLVGKNGVHNQTLIRLDSDEDMVKIINDSQNRIRDMVKNYMSELMKVHSEGDSIGVTSSTIVDAEGKESVREKTQSVEVLVSLAKALMTDPNAMLRDDYIKVVASINKNTSFRMIKDSVSWMCDNYMGKEHRLIDDFVSKVVIHSSYLIEHNIEPDKTKDIGYVLNQLKYLYLSSRSTDTDLLQIRASADKILKKAHGRVSTSLMLSTRTALILYITFRVMTAKMGK